MKYSLEALLAKDGFTDSCGKPHFAGIKGVRIGSGAVKSLPELIASLGAKKPFLLADCRSWAAAGKYVTDVLDAADIVYSRHIINKKEHIAPDEYAVGSAVMGFDKSCDIVIGIGSGVVNDTGKILAGVAGRPYIIVATAPSMDGYASATSSMEFGGFKLSLDSKAADYIVGDTDILKDAPSELIAAGVGDMVAKFISLVEWKIASIILGEYYCADIADMVYDGLAEITSNAEGLVNRDGKAIEAVMRGMVLAGISMNYAGCSRPASGLEHYFSHVWDMRGLEYGTPTVYHGLQCGVGALLALKVYDQLKKLAPDRDKALAHAKNFDVDAWFATLREFIGRGADTMIAAEARDRKYVLENHAKRLDAIIAHWDKILAACEKLPSYGELESLLKLVGAPTTPSELGHSPELVAMSFKASKDIRYKYIGSHLCHDLGVEVEL